MEQVYTSSGYQVVARSWPLAGGRIASLNPIPGAPDKQTRYQGKEIAATPLRKHGSAWMRERGVCLSRWRSF